MASLLDITSKNIFREKHAKRHKIAKVKAFFFTVWVDWPTDNWLEGHVFAIAAGIAFLRLIRYQLLRWQRFKFAALVLCKTISSLILKCDSSSCPSTQVLRHETPHPLISVSGGWEVPAIIKISVLVKGE